MKIDRWSEAGRRPLAVNSHSGGIGVWSGACFIKVDASADGSRSSRLLAAESRYNETQHAAVVGFGRGGHPRDSDAVMRQKKCE